MSQPSVLSVPGSAATQTAEFHLCFWPLFQPGRSFVFPCDAHGRVEMQDLSHRARDNYLFARAMVGRELNAPAVEKGRLAVEATCDCAVYPAQHASVWDD